jgi:DUF4097 and DUF4098 domain-containing protein YvlB
MRVETFHTPGPGALLLRVPSGTVEIEAVEGEETRVELEGLNDSGRAAVEEALVEQSGDEIRVELVKERTVLLLLRSPKVRVRVTCPVGTRLRADVVAADLTARGRLGPAVVKSVSADVELDQVEGDLELKTVSGDAVVRRVAGSASVNTVSGDLNVRELGGSIQGKTISGDLELDSVATGKVAIQSVSGDVKIGVALGVGVWMDLKSVSGDTRSELVPAEGPGGEETSTVEVRAKSVSGDIRLVRAAV